LTIAREGGNIRITWDAAPQRLLQRSETAAQGSWANLPATLGLDSYLEAIDEDTDAYFRVSDPD
jgi:hypothetical protein